MSKKPMPGNIEAIVEAMDAYLAPGASFVFLESEKTEMCILWQELKGIIEARKKLGD